MSAATDVLPVPGTGAQNRPAGQEAPAPFRPQNLPPNITPGAFDQVTGRQLPGVFQPGDLRNFEQKMQMLGIKQPGNPGALPDALAELAQGRVGPTIMAMYRDAARAGLGPQFHQEFLKLANIDPRIKVEDMTAADSPNEVRLRVKTGDRPVQSVEMKLRPGMGIDSFNQRQVIDELHMDPLTNPRAIPDGRSTSQRAADAGIKLPAALDPEILGRMKIPLPTDNPAMNPGGRAMTVGEFARAAGLQGHQIINYYEKAFFASKNPEIRQQALQGLRDEVLSNKNPSALHVLQNISATKAAIELKEAEKRGDNVGQMRALTQLASLEQNSKIAQDILRGADPKPGEKRQPHPLAAEARKEARELANQTFEPADAAYSDFLSRDMEKVPAAQRHDKRLGIIKDLDRASEERLNLMARDDFNYVKRTFQSLDALMTIKETDSPTLAAKQLDTMYGLVKTNQDSTANGYLNELDRKLKEQGKPNLDALIKDLEAGGAKGDKALAALKGALPDLTQTMNDFRLDRIMRGLNADSTSGDMAKASKALEEEVRFGNKGAEDYLKWTTAGESSLKIHEAIKARDLNDPQSVKDTALVIKTEMDRLSQMSNTGNVPARAALVGMLTEGINKDERADWRYFQDKPPHVPDLSKLSPQELLLVKERAAHAVTESLEKNPTGTPLSREDATAMSLALSDAYKNGDKNLQAALEKTFDQALKGKSREATINGLLYGMSSEQEGSAKLSDLYVKALKGGVTDNQAYHLSQLARGGNEGALRALTSIAGGAVNEQQARWAANDLIKAGAPEGQRDKVLAMMLEEYKQPGGEKGYLLAAMGTVAAKDKVPNSEVQSAVREGFAKSTDNPNAVSYKSSKEGFLAMAEHWDRQDIDALSKKLTPDMLKELPAITEKLTPDSRNYFIDTQHNNLVKGSPEERIAAVQALSTMAKFVPAGVANDLSFFASPRGQAELKRSGLTKPEDLKALMDLSGKALIAMMGSPDTKVQDAAFSAFQRKQDWPGLLGDEKLRKAIIDYAQGRPNDLELNKDAMKLVYDAGLSRPIAGVLKDIGVAGSTDELFRLADKITANYSSADVDGKEVIRKVLANAVAINAMTDEMREKLTGSKASIDLAQVIGQMAKGSIDANTPPKNALFADVKQWMRNELGERENAAFNLQQEIKAKEKFRSTALKWMGEHTKEQKIGLGDRFTDLATAILPGPSTDIVGDFERHQAMNVRRVEKTNAEIQSKMTDLGKTKSDIAFLNLAEQSMRHFELSATNVKAADQMLMSMVAAQGPQVLGRFAPSNFAQIPEAMKRLKDNGLGNQENLPFYSGPTAFSDALKDLAKLKGTAEKGWAYDYAALKTTAFQTIDSRESFQKIQGGAAEITSRLPILQEMFSSGMKGSRFEEFVRTAKSHASEIKNALDNVKPKDIADARKALAEMKDTLKTMKEGDPAREQLNERVKAYEGALDLFGGSLNHQVRNMLNEILNKDSFDETTFANWALKEGPVVALSIVAAAAVIALTAGAATPIVIAGLVVAPAAALTAGELTKQGLKWAGVRKEGSFLGEALAGSEMFDPKTGKMRKIELGDVGERYGEQYLTDLAISLGTMGAGTLLAKGISKVGQATIGKYLLERGAGLADLSKGLARAEIAAAQAGNKTFVKEFFHQLAVQGGFAGQQAIGEGILEPLMKGELQKYAPILVSMALVTAHGVSFRPQGKHIEFNLKPTEMHKAPELLTRQMLQFHNDGNTVRPGKGGAFEVISPKGEVTEFRPSKAVAEQLQNFKAPDWVTNAKPMIATPNVGDVGRLARPTEQSRTAPPEKLAAKVDRDGDTGRPRDVYRPEIMDPTEPILKGVRENLPEMNGKPVVEFDQRMQALIERWGEDHSRKQNRLNQVEPELRDAHLALEQAKAKATESVILEAQAELPQDRRSRLSPDRPQQLDKLVAEKMAALEKNPEHPIGKARIEVDRLSSEKTALTKDISNTVESRKSELQKEMDYMHEKHGWPKVTVEVGENMVGSAGGYRFGTGQLFIPKETFLSSSGKGNINTTGFHEMVHAVQDRFIAEYALHKAGGNIPKAQAIYEGISKGRTASPEYLNEVSKNPKVKEWTEVMESRAKNLAAEINEGLNVGSDSVRLGKHAQFIEGRLHSLTRDKGGKSIENLFEHFESKTHGEDFKHGLFPKGMPEEVQRAYEQYKSSKENGTEFNREAARKAVSEALQKELAETNKEHKAVVDKYANNILEVEAYAAESDKHYGSIVNGAKTPPPIAAPETVQSAKTLMDTAATKKGDSLHPESRGYEAMRKLYESKLQDGSIKPNEMKKLLELPAEDRGVIESMMKGNKLSRESFESLMKLEPKTLNEIFNNPSKIVNEVLLPAIERGLIDSQQMSKVLAMPEAQRKVALDFMEKAAKDPTRGISAESMGRFLELTQSERADVASALGAQGKAGPGQLSAADVNLALQAPTRKTTAGYTLNDSAALVQGMRSGVITPEQIKSFASLDEAGRSGMAGLMRNNALTSETAGRIFEMAKSGELKGQQILELSTAKLKGWLPEQSLETLLRQEPRVRDTVLKNLSSEIARDRAGSFVFDEVVQRATKTNELVKSGVINEKTMQLLQEPHAHDGIVGEMLRTEGLKNPSERVSAENIQKLVELSKNNEIRPDTLEAYRSAIEKGTLDNKSLGQMLEQKAEIRQAAEKFMMSAPEKFSQLVKDGRFTEMAARVPELTAAAQATFPDMFPEGGKFEHEAPKGAPSTPAMKDINEFMSRMSKGDFKGALALMEGNTVTAETKTNASVNPEVRWVEKKIALADMNNPAKLAEMHNFMKSQGTAKGTQTDAHNVNAVEKRINIADPVIEIPGGKQFKLRDSNKIYENGEWRKTTAQERALIEDVQNSPAGKAMIGKTAMILMEEWGHTQQTNSGGLSRLSGEFIKSPEYAELKAEFAKGLKGEALDARVNEALREIDISAALREAGLSTKGVKDILGDQHLKGEREFFYKFLEKQDAAKAKDAKPAAPVNSAQGHAQGQNQGTGTGPSIKEPVLQKPAVVGDAGPSGLRPSLDNVKRISATVEKPEAKLSERAAKVSPEAAKLSGLDQIMRESKLGTELGAAKLHLGEVLTGIEKLPTALKTEMMSFLEMGPNGPKAGRAQLAEHLLKVNEKQGPEAAKTLLDGMKKVCDMEAERGKRPAIPEMKDIFNPAELAKIKAVADAQDALPRLKALPPEEHAAKVDEFYKLFAGEVPGGGPPAQEKVLHIVVGPPGSGKTSTLVDPLAKDYRALVVDSDRIKPTLPGYTADFQGKPEVGLGTNAVHHPSSMVANDVLQRAMQNGDNIVYPILGRVPESLIDITMRAKAQGYKVALHIADVPPETAARRVFARADQPPDSNGVKQMVPPDYATKVAKYDPQIVFDQMVKHLPGLLDAWSHANNNVPKGEQPIRKSSPTEIPKPKPR